MTAEMAGIVPVVPDFGGPMNQLAMVDAVPAEPAQGLELRFWVPGKPATAGSKTAVPFFKGRGEDRRMVGARVLDGQNEQQRARKAAWRTDVRAAAAEAMGKSGWPEALPDQALELVVIVVRRRPADQMRSGRFAGLVKPWAEGLRPTKYPDTTKIIRAAEDALNGVAWADDSQVVDQCATKVFGDQVGMSWGSEGLFVAVRLARPYGGPPLA